MMNLFSQAWRVGAMGKDLRLFAYDVSFAPAEPPLALGWTTLSSYVANVVQAIQDEATFLQQINDPRGVGTPPDIQAADVAVGVMVLEPQGWVNFGLTTLANFATDMQAIDTTKDTWVTLQVSVTVFHITHELFFPAQPS